MAERIRVGGAVLGVRMPYEILRPRAMPSGIERWEACFSCAAGLGMLDRSGGQRGWHSSLISGTERTLKEDQESRQSQKNPVNGHELTHGFVDYPFGDLTGSTANEIADLEATRYLSAATQINIDYARNVVERVVNERFKALAPTFGVDVPVVVKWAMKALHTRSIRDYSLTVLLALQSFSVVLYILWWREAWIFLLCLLAAAWIVTSWEYHERIHNSVIGKMLRNRFKPEEAPHPPREADRERLRAVAERRDGNLVVFSGHSAFIGSGDLIYRKRLLLDIVGRKDSSGLPDGQLEKFTSNDLHAAILEAFDREHGLGKNLNNIKAYERLFVNGLHVQNNQNLLPDPLRPPPTSVDGAFLHAAAVNPSPEARTYVCIEMPGWQGQLVVTLFIRAVYAGRSLFVEWTFRVLPPIRDQFLNIDKLHELPRRIQLRNSLAFGLRTLVPALLGSPIHAYSSWIRPRIAKRHHSRSSYAIRKGYIFDYGARSSIREDASGTRRQHYFLARDETMYVLLAQQTLIRAVQDFLTEHGVDLGQFEDQVKVLVEQSINYNIGDISDSSGVVIGNNSSATVSDSSKGSM